MSDKDEKLQLSVAEYKEFILRQEAILALITDLKYQHPRMTPEEFHTYTKERLWRPVKYEQTKNT